MCFGDYDVVVVASFPDNVSAAAISIVIAAGGAFRKETTPLLSVEEGLEATKKAATSGYRPPGGEGSTRREASCPAPR